jgi:hypothetical protein
MTSGQTLAQSDWEVQVEVQNSRIFSSRGEGAAGTGLHAAQLEALLSAVGGTRTLRVRPLILIGRRRVWRRGATVRFCIDARALRGMRGGSQA